MRRAFGPALNVVTHIWCWRPDALTTWCATPTVGAMIRATGAPSARPFAGAIRRGHSRDGDPSGNPRRTEGAADQRHVADAKLELALEIGTN
jgi:hypothetical protein